MMLSWCLNIIIFICLIVSSRTARIKDVIGFPEIEENPLLVNKQDRIPVFLPSMCPENELYYPGDQADDWICDCRAGYLFHPDSDKCWLAYEKGPCPAEQYLTLPTDSMIPVCVPNPCKNDSMVLWHGECKKLGSRVCGDLYPTQELWVNAVTLKVDCVNIYGNNIMTYSMASSCPPGCRRSVQNKSTSNPTTISTSAGTSRSNKIDASNNTQSLMRRISKSLSNVYVKVTSWFQY